jgi:hypothetical protein
VRPLSLRLQIQRDERTLQIEVFHNGIILRRPVPPAVRTVELSSVGKAKRASYWPARPDREGFQTPMSLPVGAID